MGLSGGSIYIYIFRITIKDERENIGLKINIQEGRRDERMKGLQDGGRERRIYGWISGDS